MERVVVQKGLTSPPGTPCLNFCLHDVSGQVHVLSREPVLWNILGKREIEIFMNECLSF